MFGAILAHAEASVLLARSEVPRATEVALAGATEGDAGSAPLWAGRCRTLAGAALAADGRADDARRELRRTVAKFEACGAWGYRDDALRVLRRLGDRPRPAGERTRPARHGRDGPLGALTRREREVALLIADGRTNAQIAAALHLTESTVEKHVSRVLAKLAVSSRAGVVRLLAERRASLP